MALTVNVKRIFDARYQDVSENIAIDGVVDTSTLVETVNTVSASGSAITIPAPETASLSRVTLTANCTITLPTAAAGVSFSIVLVQDSTGGRTVTWSGSVKWPGAASPTLTGTAASIDVITFACADGSNWLGFPAGYDMR